MDGMEKKQHKLAAAIKQKCNREAKKRMWYLIKRKIKDLQNRSILKVQRAVDREVREYEVQEDAKMPSRENVKLDSCWRTAYLL